MIRRRWRWASVRRATWWLPLGVAFLPWWGAAHVQAATNFDLEDRVREIASELRCVVCQNLSVADSPSDLAKEMRNLVRELVQQGKSPEEIQADLISQYVPDWRKVDQKRDRRLGHLRVFLAADLSHHAALSHLLRQNDWDFAAYLKREFAASSVSVRRLERPYKEQE